MANLGDGTVSVITTASGAVSAPITVGRDPHWVAITPDRKHAYVSNDIDGTVSVITTATGAVSAPITAGHGPHGVAITPDGKHAYVANTLDVTVSVITTATGAVTPISVGKGPVWVAKWRSARHGTPTDADHDRTDDSRPRPGVRGHACVDLGGVAELPGARAQGQPTFKP